MSKVMEDLREESFAEGQEEGRREQAQMTAKNLSVQGLSLIHIYWLDKDKSSYNYRYEVLKHYFTWDLLERLRKVNACISDEACSDLNSFEQARFKQLYYELVSSTSWKMTKPLRKILDCLKGKKSTKIDPKGIYDYKQLYEQAISSTSWKLTKPLRNMKDSVMAVSYTHLSAGIW